MTRKQYIELRNTKQGNELLYTYYQMNGGFLPVNIYMTYVSIVGVNNIISTLDNKYDAIIIIYNDKFLKAI